MRRHTRLARALERWFETNRRDLPWRDRYDPWEVWVSEVMAQQTRMDVAVRRFPEFIARFPTVAAMASSSERDVLAAWSGLGYYRRAKMLRLGAIDVVERLGGVVPDDPDVLRSIPGIGRYTAGAIASIAFDRAAPIVDGNVARLVARLEALDHPWKSGDLDRAAWRFSEALVGSAKSPRRVNQAAMEIGAGVCRPRSPRCGECPLASDCRACASGRADAYPVPAARRESLKMTIPLYLVSDRRGRILMVEARGRLMSGMLHLPHGGPELLPGTVSDSFEPGEAIGSVSHTVTNRRIEFVVHRATVRERIGESAESFVWIDVGTLDDHPIPSYVRKALELAGAI